MPLTNCEVELILIWSANCVIIYTDVANQNPTFAITETNLYVPVVTLSTQDNAKLLPQLKLGFKRTISWSKYLSKPELLQQNLNLNHLIEPSFQGVNRLFVLVFENDDPRISNKRHYLPNVEINNYNVMIDSKIFFDQPINSRLKTYDNIRKVATGQGDADPKAIQQIIFTGNLEQETQEPISFLKRQKKLFLNFHKEL